MAAFQHMCALRICQMVYNVAGNLASSFPLIPLLYRLEGGVGRLYSEGAQRAVQD